MSLVSGLRSRLLYLVLDGLGDEPSSSLGGRTPLEAARAPHFDTLAREGDVFRLHLADEEGTAATHIGQFGLLGYGPGSGIPRRGPVEATATGMTLEAGDVALRANLATLDAAGRIVDRRAGRIREGAEELCQILDEMDLGDGVRALIRGATEHRASIVLRGEGLSAAVTDSDPGTLAHGPTPPLRPQALDPANQAAVRTAEKLELFLQKAHTLLEPHPINRQRQAQGLPPANAVLTREAGSFQPLPDIETRHGLRCIGIAAERTVLGVLRLIGAPSVTQPEFTANTDTSLEGKFEAALKLLHEDFDIVMLHIKATDILSHDQKPLEKSLYLEKIDANLGRALDLLPESTFVALGSDHSTSSITGDHILAPVPAFLWGPGIPASGVPRFHEKALREHGAPLLQGEQFFARLASALRTRPHPDQGPPSALAQ